MFRHKRFFEASPLDAFISGAQLTNKEYEVLLKRYKQDLSLEQIAAEMRIPVRQVERLEKHALKAVEETRENLDSQEPDEEFVRSVQTFKIPVFQGKDSREIKRKRLIEESLDNLRAGDNVSQWFHFQLQALGLRHLMKVCSECLNDQQLVGLASVYGEGYTFDQVRQLLKLRSKQEAKDLVRDGIQKFWDYYPELALKSMFVA